MGVCDVQQWGLTPLLAMGVKEAAWGQELSQAAQILYCPHPCFLRQFLGDSGQFILQAGPACAEGRAVNGFIDCILLNPGVSGKGQEETGTLWVLPSNTGPFRGP